MYGYGYYNGFKKSSGPSYDPDAQALFDHLEDLGIPETTERKACISNVIKYWKLSNIWDELDYVYGWAVMSTRAASLVDWKNPLTRVATPVNSYAGDWVINQGFKGSTANQFRIMTGFNPGDGGSYKFTQNNNSFGYGSRINVDEFGVDISAIVGTEGIELLSNISQRIPSVKNNFGTARNVQNVTNVGQFSSRRTASNLYTTYRSGYNLHDVTNPAPTDIALPVKNLEIALFCRNVSGVYSTYSNKWHTHDFAGSGNFDHFTLYNILDQYALRPLGITPEKRIMFNGNSMTQTITYANRVLDIVGRNNYDVLKRGLNNQTTPLLATDAIVNIFPKQKTFLTKDVFFFFELTNDMFNTTSNVTTCYNNLVAYLTTFKSYFPDTKIVVATCLPRTQSANFQNANRQNDADLFDDATLNGKIRNHLVQDGYADAIADCASDPTMGIYSNGVAGVGELNLTYYADGIHPTTTGYNLLADTYFHPALVPYI